MEARRKGVEGRMVVTRDRRSNSGRSSRAKPCEGCVGWRARVARGRPLSLSFQIPERSSPSRVRCAAPTSRALDVSGPFRTRCSDEGKGANAKAKILARAAGCRLPLVGIEACGSTEAIILRKPPRRLDLNGLLMEGLPPGLRKTCGSLVRSSKSRGSPHKPRGSALPIKER